MSTKNFLTQLLIFLVYQIHLFCQSDTIDYFGQEPPGIIPQKFSPGFISLEDRYEFNPVFSPDGKEFYFTVSNPPSWSFSKTMVSRYVDSTWTEPVEIDFGGKPLDWGLCFSSNGDTLFFNSCTSNWILDIYFVVRNGEGWSEAKELSDTINSIGSEIIFSVSNNSTLYFRSTQSQHLGSGSQPDLFLSKKSDSGYSSYKNIGVPVNSEYEENNPIVAPDESYLIFTVTNRFKNDRDICISYAKENGGWTNPKILVENAESGSLTPDNKYLLYHSFHEYGANQTDIFWVKIDSIIDSLKNTNYVPYVLNPIPDQSGIHLNSYSYTIPDTIFNDDDGNNTLTISATLSNGDSLPDGLTFYLSENKISGVLKNAGTFDIKVIATDTAGETASDIFELTVNDTTTSINTCNTFKDLELFPNPSNRSIYIRTGSSLPVFEYYTIIDVNGIVVKKSLFKSEEIDISQISQGVYYIIFESKNTVISKLFIKN